MPARARLLARHVRGPADAFLFLRIVCFAALAPALLRLRLSQVERLLLPRGVTAPYNERRVRTIVSLTDAAMVIGKPVVRRSCLVRAVTLYYFLTRAGMDLRLCFGIGEMDNALTGHCWLVKDGQPYLEKQDPRRSFTVIYNVPGGGSGSTITDRVYRVAR